MIGFLSELGKKAADRWLELLVLPGLLWIGTLTVGLHLGQYHALNLSRLRVWINQLHTSPASHDLATVTLVGVSVLLGSATVGFTVGALGRLAQGLWALAGEQRPILALLKRRQQRWDEATKELKAAVVTASQTSGMSPGHLARAEHDARQAKRRRDRLGTARPERPFVIGERLYRASTRIREHNHLDLDLVWPRLWSVLPDALRADIDKAQTSYTSAGRTTAWGISYLLISTVWWPAAAIGLAIGTTGWLQAREAADTLASLIETAADLHIDDLAKKLRINTDVDLNLGREINRLLRD